MKINAYRSLLIVIGFLGTVLLSACEGGQPRAARDCQSGFHEVNGRCVADTNSGVNQCPAGQVLSNNTCVQKDDCPIGYHAENGQCVENSLTCDAGQHQSGQECVDDQLSVEVVSKTACWLPRYGAVRLVTQYTTRDEAGKAVDPLLDEQNQPTALATEIFVNGEPADIEAVLNRESELLKSNIALSLVLDASSSMLAHTPPAFEPMKASAIEILENTRSTWEQNESEFHWELAWFDRLIYRPTAFPDGRSWTISDIGYLPEPPEGSYTGLYKAIHHMTDVHQNLYNAGVAAKSRDQHIMVVLSDGKDNQGHVDNSEEVTQANNNQIYWDAFGKAATSLADVEVGAGLIPNLRIYVIGLGDSINEGELEQIAQFGNGQYFYGSDGDAVADVFSAVQKELTTLQTLGIEAPLAPAEYTFSLIAKHASGAEGETSFTMDVGPELGECND